MADPYLMEAEVILQDSTLSPDQVAKRIVSLCQSVLRDAPATRGNAYNTDTPGLEKFLWGLWDAMIALAEEDSSRHDRLSAILAAMKLQGREDWEIWRQPFDWADLPIFGPSVRESFNGPMLSRDDIHVSGDDPDYLVALSGDPPTESRASLAGARARLRRLNLNAFLARLWTLDVWRGAFYAIATMRMSLEPHSRPVYSTYPDARPASVELEIEVAAVWVRVAGRRMLECREIMGPKGNPDWAPERGCPGGSGGTWDGVDGFHPDRWQHWKGIFRDISRGKWRQNVIDAAKAAVEAMEEAERKASAAVESTVFNIS